jgi:hypothetical protein
MMPDWLAGSIDFIVGRSFYPVLSTFALNQALTPPAIDSLLHPICMSRHLGQAKYHQEELL